MKKLNITFCSFPDFAGNAKALYEYMVKTYKDRMNYTWVVYNKNTVDKLREKGINAVLIDTDEFKKYIPKTNVFFTTHANLTGDKLKCKNAIYVELWHGVSPKKIGYMMNNISKADEQWYRKLSYLLDYIIVPSEFWQSIYANRFYLNINQILPIAYPKLDLIKNDNSKENLSKILDTNLKKYNKIIFYTPTFRSGCGRKNESTFGNNILNLEKYNEKNLIKYLEDNNYLLCIKKHPSEEENITKNIKESHNIKIIHNEKLENSFMDIYDILDAADLLITDFSSLGIEFIYLNKPVIYLDTDKNEYSKNRGIIFDDFDFWSLDLSTNTFEGLTDLISKKFNNSNYQKTILNRKSLYFSGLKNGGCSNICNFFFTQGAQLKKIKKIPNDSYNFFELNNKVTYLNQKIEYYKKTAEDQEKLINQMVNSRGWKFLEKIRKLLRR